VGLNVTYTDKTSRSITIAEAAARGMIWWNANPTTNADDTFGVYDVRTSSTTPGKTLLNYNKIAEPIVKVNYRGATAEVPVDIFTKVEALNVQYTTPPTEGDSITVDMRFDDNDIAGRHADWYGQQVTATATVTSYSTGNTKELGLTYWGDTNVTDANKAEGAVGQNTNYSMNFGKPAWPTTTAVNGSNTGWTDAWTSITVDAVKLTKYGLAAANTKSLGVLAGVTPAFGQCNTIKNNDKEASVTFYYSPPPGYMDGALNATGNIATKALKNTLQVYWTNIHKN